MKYLAFLVFLVGCGINSDIVNSKFKIDDCVRTVTVIDPDSDTEFLKEDPMTIILEYKVLAVGKKKYHLQFGKELFTERKIEHLDEDGIKINCKDLRF